MTLNPEVVKKAQAEIDSVIGQDRLPSFADRERLPYINAIVLEVMRWHSVTPTSNQNFTSPRSHADLMTDYTRCPSSCDGG